MLNKTFAFSVGCAFLMTLQASPVALAQSNGAGATSTITGLDYKANENGGTIVVHTDKPVTYTTRSNQGNHQFVVELGGTSVPNRFQRPYVTKEFGGSFTSFNAYQSQDGGSTRIVIQTKDGVTPDVTQQGGVIKIAAAGGAPAAKAAPAASPAEESDEEDADSDLTPPSDDMSPNSPAAENKEINPPAPQQDSDEETQAEGQPVTKEQTTQTSVASAKTHGKPTQDQGLIDFLTGNSKFYGKPISIEMKDADIKDALRFIAEESGVNILVDDDVSGKISIKLRKVPWDQALAAIMESHQLGYVREGNILRIATLKALQAQTDTARTFIDAQRQLQPLHVQLFPLSYAVGAELEPQIKPFLSARGSVKSDKRTNTLIVSDIDEDLEKVKALVKRLDTQTPEVLIEAKVVEAREQYSKIIGFNWQFSGQPMQVGGSSTGSQVMLTPNVTSQLGGSSGGAFNAGFQMTGLDFFGDLTASLQLLETEGLVKVLSAPRVATVNRQEAKIEQDVQSPVFSTTQATLGVAPQATVTFQDAKLSLDVTPEITADGSIFMDVDVVREFFDAPITVQGSEASAKESRHAHTKILVENGDTVVIGGIYQSDNTFQEQGVPVLKDLPFIGALFRNRSLKRDKNELVIFLTPRILNRERAFVKAGLAQ